MSSTTFISVEEATRYVLHQAESMQESTALAEEVQALWGDNSRSPDAIQKYLKLVRLLYRAGRLSLDEYVFCFDFQVEGIVDDRLMAGEYGELSKIDEQLDRLRQKYCFDETTQAWPNEEEPSGFSTLTTKFGEAYEDKYIEAIEEFGAHELAQLKRSDPAEYDVSRERGRKKFFEPEKTLEALNQLILTYEDQAQKCGNNGIYLGAVIMLGSAAESRLLLKSLICDADAICAYRGVTSRGGRKPSQDPLTWSFDFLVKVAVEADWIQGLEIQDEKNSTGGLATLIRTYRNNVHPGRFIKDRTFVSIGKHEYEQVQAGYVLLREALT
ncbi:hypothetical protein HGE68_01235 [Rhodobacteraceae bacterium R_SAG6]|nr:hypothetical protein [Rhodobacteraceae bacterium R_SAG6]